MKRSYVVTLILNHYPYLKFHDVVSRLQSSSYVSLPRRYLYWAIPKAACTTMKEVLHTVEDLPPIQFFVDSLRETRRDMFIHARENMPMPSLVDLDDRTQRDVLESPDFLRMTVVRNPYARLVSAWRNRVLLCEPWLERLYLEIRGQLPGPDQKSLLSFEEFLDYVSRCDLRTCNGHWARQVDRLFLKAIHFNHIGKVERMSETWQRFQQHLRTSDPLPVSSKNVSVSAPAAEFTEALASKIYSLYQADFEAFGYDRNSWPKPREHSDPSRNGSMVPEAKFIDEIIERNLVISYLYQERDRLRAQLQRTPSALFRRFCNKLRRRVRNLPFRGLRALGRNIVCERVK